MTQGKDDLRGKWNSISIPLEHPCFAYDPELSKELNDTLLDKFSQKA